MWQSQHLDRDMWTETYGPGHVEQYMRNVEQRVIACTCMPCHISLHVKYIVESQLVYIAISIYICSIRLPFY